MYRSEEDGGACKFLADKDLGNECRGCMHFTLVSGVID